MRWIPAVSYTHLDVYKRQSYSINRDIQRSFRDLEQTVQPDEFSVETQKPAKTPKSKSEKETDVYKRQQQLHVR